MEYLKYDNLVISHDKVINRRKITKIHYHDSGELYYLLSGKTKYFVGDKTYILEKGNLIFIPSNTLHSCDSEDTLHNERIVISIPDSFFDETTRGILRELMECNYIYIPPENLHVVDELINKINKEYTKERKYNSVLIKLYILELLTLLCRLKKEYTHTSTETEELIREVAEYIRQNFSDQITLAYLSKRFAISKEYLSRQFKAVLGVGFSDFLTYVRITKAELLLSETDMPITKIAAECGFNDSNYFAAVFKRLKGVTPYKYSKISFMG